jgi:hypothetical protein
MTLALLRTTGWLPYWNITDVPLVPLAVCVNVPVEVAQLAGICTICGYIAAELNVLDGFGVTGMAAEDAVVVAIEMALMGEEEVATVEERVEQAIVEGDVVDDEDAHCTLANMAVVVLLLLELDPTTLGTNWMAVALDDDGR